MTEQEAPAGCLWLATSTGCQGAYVGIGAFACLLVCVSLFIPAEMYVIVDSIFWLCLMVSGSSMCGSRICAPQCCSGLEEVPPCCPCNCFAQLDLPYYIWFGFAAVAYTVDIVLTLFIEISPMFLKLFWITKLVNPGLAIAAASCAITKLCIMKGVCCPEQMVLAQRAAGLPPAITQSAGQVVVVGQPIVVDQKA